MKDKESFIKQDDIEIHDNQFTIEIMGKAVYSLTNTYGQQKGNYHSPPAADFPFPYRTDFEEEKTGRPAKYFSDQAGIFEIAKRTDGKGQSLKQVITQQ